MPRPAIYFINLKTIGDWPKYSLPALTFHEGVPGHHLQISLAQTSADLPMLRKISFYSAYGEGWALYAEQLADELGAYQDIERAGYLRSYLFRASRLVVDTGLNSAGAARKRSTIWSRPPASPGRASSAGSALLRLDRPGLSYRPAIARTARAGAQRSGPHFDLKQFHEVLKDGSAATILERRIVERAEAAKRG